MSSRSPPRIHINLHGSVSDVLANIVLFIPLGFLFQLARRRAGWRSLLQALCFGVLVSAAVEACQLFLPGRDSSLIDVATNGLGAVLGAAAAAYQRARVRQEQVPLVFAFEMPLMNVVYLLIPLLLARRPFHGRGADPAGADDGAGCVRRQRDRLRVREPHGVRQDPCRLMPALYASGWFMIGTLPAVAAFPIEVLTAAGVVAAAAGLSARLWKGRNKSERRFELPTLRKVFPLYGLYLLLLSVWPTTLPL